jgi:hypothetical protein
MTNKMTLSNSFERYANKVFHLIPSLSLLKDTRKRPRIEIQDIVWGYYLGSALRMKAISTIEEEIGQGVLKRKVKQSISDDTFGYGLDHLEPQSLQEVWYKLARRAKRNGMLRDGPFHDYIVGVLDGIETFSSYKKDCDNCLTRKVLKKMPGQEEKVEMIQNYHRAVVITLVGYDFPIPLGMEMMRKGEDEVSCALRLLQRIVDSLGVRFLDIVIGDALYCTPNFFKECEKLGIAAGAVLKINQENLLESALAQKKITKPTLVKKKAKEELRLWDLQAVFWDTADKDVRVIWADREVLEKGENSQRNRERSSDNSGQPGHWVDKKNVFAFSKQINLPSAVVYAIGRHRWDIDAKLFMDMTTHWHLKHKTLHFPRAYENMLTIRLMASMVFMFFFYRHINSRRKKKIKSYVKMARMLYRDCAKLEPEDVLLE